MSTFLWVTATVFTLSALLGSSMHRGAARMVWLGWWGGVFTMIAVWHWWATRAVG